MINIICQYNGSRTSMITLYSGVSCPRFCYSNRNIASYIKEVETYCEKIYLEQ